MYKLFLFLILTGISLTGCHNQKNTLKMTVASSEADCVGVAPQKCLLVKKGNNPSWEFMYTRIKGFDYTPGYEYVLEVKEERIPNPASDQSSISYTLVKEISKVKKESENLPFIPKE